MKRIEIELNRCDFDSMDIRYNDLYPLIMVYLCQIIRILLKENILIFIVHYNMIACLFLKKYLNANYLNSEYVRLLNLYWLINIDELGSFKFVNKLV